MTGTPVAIGPFFGGLNTVNDPSTIAENQCSTLENFDIDIDGTLVSRPGFTTVNSNYASSLLCTYTNQGQTFVIASYRIFNNATDEHIGAVDVKTDLTTKITSNINNVKYADALQYLDRVWLIAEVSGAAGGWWTPSSNFTAVAGMPNGVAMVVYKERLFVASPGGRISFSKVGEFDQWEASSFFDVSPGDGQKIQSMIVHQDQIIIFKDQSTYVLAYDAAPEGAMLQKVSGEFGTESRRSVCVHEGLIYTFHDNNLYAINNWRWQKVSMQVNLFEPESTALSPAEYRDGVASLSSVGRRVIVRYRTSHWAYFPDLEAWATWAMIRSTVTVFSYDRWLELPENHVSGYREYWAGTYVRHVDPLDNESSSQIFKLVDGHAPSISYTSFKSTIASKMYDLEMPYNFKRLHWWGADILTRVNVDAVVYPETYNRKITWDEFNALGKTWDQLAAEGRTWDRLADVSIIISDGYKFGYQVGVRSFVKFIKSLRFRKALFELSATAAPGSHPVRIFSAMAVVSNKQLGPRKAN